MIAPRLCLCGHVHGGRAYGLCLAVVNGVLCPCLVVRVSQ